MGVPSELTEEDVKAFVVVKDGALRAEHAFWLFGFPILTLHYRITRKAESLIPQLRTT